jgi:hypothetical protein
MQDGWFCRSHKIKNLKEETTHSSKNLFFKRETKNSTVKIEAIRDSLNFSDFYLLRKELSTWKEQLWSKK